MSSESELPETAQRESPLPVSYIVEGENPDIDLAVRILRKRGYVILRGCLPKDAIDAVAERTEDMLQQPSVAGVWGYYRADHQKKVIQPTLLGAPVYSVIANERVVDIAETYFGSECILAETNLKFDRGVGYSYFPLHSDFAVGWHKSADHVSPVTEETMKMPLGVGDSITALMRDAGYEVVAEWEHYPGFEHYSGDAIFVRDDLVEEYRERMARSLPDITTH
ncbi:MAG: hypothetical protein ACPGRZ_05080 [Alphaproteobacteria bacterium]